MTDNAAVMLPFLRDLYCFEITEMHKDFLMDSGQRAGEFFLKLYRYEKRERIRLALLDDSLMMKKCILLAEGHPSAASLSVRRITEAAIAGESNLLILAHNHPNGTAKPSDVDISTTRILAAALKKNDISLMDHIIVGESGYCSLRQCGAFLGIS